MVMDTHVIVDEPNDDEINWVDYWWATGEGWENISPAEQDSILARLAASPPVKVTEARLEEHPGHASQLVHGHRGGAGVSGAAAGTPVAKHVMRRMKPGGVGVFGREAPNWQDNARKGKTTRVFASSIEKALCEGPVVNMQEIGGGTNWSGTAEIGGHLAYVKPENGAWDGTVDRDGKPSPRVSDDYECSIPAGTEPERELASHYIDKALGGMGVGVPPTIIRAGLANVTGMREPSMDTFTTDAKTRWTVTADVAGPIVAAGGKVHQPGDFDFNDIAPAERRKLALFDSLIGNTDRHSENWVPYTDKHGAMKAAPIDHGLAFPRRAGWGNNDFQQDSYRLSKSERASVAKLVKNRAKVRRDLRAILKDDDAVDGFFSRLDFIHRTGRTIDVYDMGAVRSSRPVSGDWSALSVRP